MKPKTLFHKAAVNMKRKTRVAAAVGLLSFASSAWSIPLLQLYVEGANYDDVSDTWTLTSTDPLRLWVLGLVGGSEGKGTIFDVKLSIAYASTLTPTFSLLSSTTNDYKGYADPSAPVTATFSKTVTDGSAPILGDGSFLPSHGIYGDGTSWQEFKLGDFSLQDSQIGDFMTSAPDASGEKVGQINVYEFSVAGSSVGDVFHFDVYDHIVGGNDFKYINAPFSHDASSSGGSSTGGGSGGTGGDLPEPGTLALLGLSLFGLACLRKDKFSVKPA